MKLTSHQPKSGKSPALFFIIAVASIFTVIAKSNQYLFSADQSSWKVLAGVILFCIPFLTISFKIINDRTFKHMFLAAGMVLCLLALEVMVSKGWQVQNFLEHALQWGLPLATGYLVFTENSVKTLKIIRILTAITFFGHGIYALGIQISSTNFVPLTTGILGISAEEADIFLKIAGALDMIVVLSALTGFLWKYVIWYALVWSIVTTTARLVYFGILGAEGATLAVALTETGYRVCHIAGPAAELLNESFTVSHATDSSSQIIEPQQYTASTVIYR
jgi:hypothetical protein